MATVNKVKKNGADQWVVRYQNPRTGKQVSKFFPKKKMADEFLLGTLEGLKRGTHTVEAETVTLDRALDAFLEDCERRVRLRENMPGTKHTMTRHTMRNYERAAKKYLRPELGRVKLHKLTRHQCQDVVNNLAERFEGGPQKLVGILLTLTLKMASDRGWLAANPLAGKPLHVPMNNERTTIPTQSEIRALLDALQERQYDERQYAHETRRAIFAFPLYAGLRRGEVAGLQWEDIDLVNGVIQVRHSYSAVDGLKEPKSKAGIRDVPLLPQMRAVLQPIGERQGWPSNGYVLVNREGKTIYMDMWEVYFEPVMVRAGLVDEKGKPKFRYHDLRHAFVSLLIQNGLSAVEIAKVVGHSDVRTTLSVYARVFEDCARTKETMLRVGASFPMPEDTSVPVVTRGSGLVSQAPKRDLIATRMRPKLITH